MIRIILSMYGGGLSTVPGCQPAPVMLAAKPASDA